MRGLSLPPLPPGAGGATWQALAAPGKGLAPRQAAGERAGAGWHSAGRRPSRGAAGAVAALLSAEQQQLVQARAAAVPPRWRDKFFCAVADRLAPSRSPTNREVVDACAAARRAIAVGIGVPAVD